MVAHCTAPTNPRSSASTPTRSSPFSAGQGPSAIVQSTVSSTFHPTNNTTRCSGTSKTLSTTSTTTAMTKPATSSTSSASSRSQPSSSNPGYHTGGQREEGQKIMSSFRLKMSVHQVKIIVLIIFHVNLYIV